MKSILWASLAFSGLTLAVLAFRRFRGKNYSRRLARALWIVVVLRMVIPLTFSDSLTVIRLPQNALTEKFFQSSKADLAPSPPNQEAVAKPDIPLANQAAPQEPQQPPADLPDAPFLPNDPAVTGSASARVWTGEQILFAVWAVGVLASLGVLGTSYLRFRSDLKRKIRRLHPQTENAIVAELGRNVRLFALEGDESPMTVGVFSPALVLPTRLLPDEKNPRNLSEALKFVLKHEFAHIRKRDLWLKSLYLLGRSLHWFNPLSYLIQGPLNEDIELATDEEVAHGMAKDELGAYCRSILEVAEALPAAANNYSSRFTGDVKTMKKRISVLFQQQKFKRGVSVLVLIGLLAVLSVGLISCEFVQPIIPEQTVTIDPDAVATEDAEITIPASDTVSDIKVSRTEIGKLTLLEYNFPKNKPDQTYIQTLLPDQNPFIAAYAGKRLSSRNTSLIIGGKDEFVTFEESGENGSYTIGVKKNGEPVFTLPWVTTSEDLGSAMILGVIRSFEKIGDSWLLEAVREAEEAEQSGTQSLDLVGEIYLDGVSVNQEHGYTSAYDFQILDGLPFFFFERNGKPGVSYNWQEFDLPVESVVHYVCCSAGIDTVQHFENMVVFVSDGSAKQYYQLVSTRAMEASQALGSINLLSEVLPAETNGLKMELLQASQQGDRLTLTVKYPLLDWRGWGISNIKLQIDEKSYEAPQHRLVEQKTQKLENQVCVLNTLTGESCEEGTSTDLYRIEDLTFSGIPIDLEGRKIVLQIWGYKVDPPEGEGFCEVMRVEYLQDVLEKKYPGLKLNCIAGQGLNAVELMEGTPFADDPQAKNDFMALLQELVPEGMAGPWSFVIMEYLPVIIP